jgi:hypothetical protein
MTVREFIQNILLAAPDLDATIYISHTINEDTEDIEAFDVDKITSWGNNDMVDIVLREWRSPW